MSVLIIEKNKMNRVVQVVKRNEDIDKIKIYVCKNERTLRAQKLRYRGGVSVSDSVTTRFRARVFFNNL